MRGGELEVGILHAGGDAFEKVAAPRSYSLSSAARSSAGRGVYTAMGRGSPLDVNHVARFSEAHDPIRAMIASHHGACHAFEVHHEAIQRGCSSRHQRATQGFHLLLAAPLPHAVPSWRLQIDDGVEARKEIGVGSAQKFHLRATPGAVFIRCFKRIQRRALARSARAEAPSVDQDRVGAAMKNRALQPAIVAGFVEAWQRRGALLTSAAQALDGGFGQFQIVRAGGASCDEQGMGKARQFTAFQLWPIDIVERKMRNARICFREFASIENSCPTLARRRRRSDGIGFRARAEAMVAAIKDCMLSLIPPNTRGNLNTTSSRVTAISSTRASNRAAIAAIKRFHQIFRRAGAGGNANYTQRPRTRPSPLPPPSPPACASRGASAFGDFHQPHRIGALRRADHQHQSGVARHRLHRVLAIGGGVADVFLVRRGDSGEASLQYADDLGGVVDRKRRLRHERRAWLASRGMKACARPRRFRSARSRRRAIAPWCRSLRGGLHGRSARSRGRPRNGARPPRALSTPAGRWRRR